MSCTTSDVIPEVELVQLEQTKKQRDKRLPDDFMVEPQVIFDVGASIGIEYGVTVTDGNDIIGTEGSCIYVISSCGSRSRVIENEELNDVWNVVAKGDTLYVSDRLEKGGRILVMNMRGNLVKIIDLPGNIRHDGIGLAVTDDGDMYMSSESSNTIFKYCMCDNTIKTFITKDREPALDGPAFLCLSPKKDLIVSNFESHMIQVYNKDGDFLWHYRGELANRLSHPYGVCCDSKGYVFIADMDHHRIVVIQDGFFIKVIRPNNSFRHPFCVAIDKEDNLICRYGKKVIKMQIWKSDHEREVTDSLLVS